MIYDVSKAELGREIKPRKTLREKKECGIDGGIEGKEDAINPIFLKRK